MNFKSHPKVIYFILPVLLLNFMVYGQPLSDYKVESSGNNHQPTVVKNINFNGYTNYWQNYYTQWHRYGNLFKIAVSDLHPTILQSKIDVAEDLKLPGLLMQEGFLSLILKENYKVVENPSLDKLENIIDRENSLVIVNPTTDLGQMLDKKSESIFKWSENIPSYQFQSTNLEKIKAFYLVNE